jgi:ATP-dependent Zn protease
MSGAQIAAVCNEAALHAARFNGEAVTEADFEHAIDRVLGGKSLQPVPRFWAWQWKADLFHVIGLPLWDGCIGLERPSRVISAEEKRVIAVHEAGHAIVSWFLRHTEVVTKISVVPRGLSLGVTRFLPSDQHLYSSSWFPVVPG